MHSLTEFVSLIDDKCIKDFKIELLFFDEFPYSPWCSHCDDGPLNKKFALLFFDVKTPNQQNRCLTY